MPMHSPCRHQDGFRSVRVIAVLIIALFPLLFGCSREPEGPALTLAPLPWATDALSPVISEETIKLHYGKHHAGYVAKANALISTSRFKKKGVVDILSATRGKKKHEALFNNMAQAWNHAFFWQCLTPKGEARPTGPMAEAINTDFGGWTGFREAFVKAATTHFGSGWVWLVSDQGKLDIITTVNADTPVAFGLTPLFTIDLWEHAYYLDFQNRRKEYVEGVFDKLANWKAVEKRYQP